MIKSSSVLYIVSFLIIVLLLTPDIAAGAEYHGLVSMNDFYSNDSASAYDFHLLTTRFRLDADKLNKKENLSFHFEGRQRNNLGSNDYSSKSSNSRIDTMYIEYRKYDRTDYLLGRLWPKELYAERIDGLNILRHGSDSGIGFFAGIKPDPYNQGFNSNYTAAGAYYYRHKTNNSASIAFIHNGYKGRTDRQYIYGQASYSPSDKIRLFGTITADIDQVSKDLDLKNAIIELTYRPDYRKGLTAGYNQFRAVRYYKSMDFDIDTGMQQSYYIQGDYHLGERYSLYGRYNLQTLNYNSLEQELRASSTYQIGLRNDNLFNSHISMDLNAAKADSYGSNYDTYEVQFSRYINDMLQLTLHSAYMQSTSEITYYTDRSVAYDVSGHYFISRMWNVSFSYQGRDSKDYNTNTISTRISYKF